MVSAPNPFSTSSALPFALPPFDDIGVEHFPPAFDTGMAEHRAEVDGIIANPDAPTFENTIVALELSGQTLARTSTVFFNLISSNSTAALRAIESEFAGKLTAHSDAIRLDPALFARIKDVHVIAQAATDLDAESKMLIRRYHLDFVLAGAGLDEAGGASWPS